MDNRWLGIRSGMVLGCLLFVALLRCEAQNLINNHSFEERDTCLEINTWYYPDTGPLGWFSAAGTGDYFMSCLPYGAFNGVPLNAWSYQYPQDGDAYVGVVTYNQPSSAREYFAIELTDPLQVGETYYASLYASASWNGNLPNPQLWLASGGIGFRFMMDVPQWEFGDPFPLPGLPGNFAHVYRPDVLADTVNWVLVSGSFVADSAYRYALIGNHFDNDHTDTLHFANYAQYARAHTLIDNVCVSRNPLGCPLVNGVDPSVTTNVMLFADPATGTLNVSGIRAGSMLSIHDGAGRLVWHGTTAGDTWALRIADWSRGLYVLRLEDPGMSSSFKFVLAE